MDFSKTLFRASSMGKIMTASRSRSEPLGETCKKHLVEVFVREKYGRVKELDNKYVTKGLMVEEDAITLYSRVKKTYFKKNADRITNEYETGLPDLFTGKGILQADTIKDVKSSWDIYTFFNVYAQGMDKDYYWQAQTYMDLTGAKSATIAYCLINTPEVLINDEKRRLLWKMGVATEENPDYQEAIEELDKSMRFDDIPMEDRVIEFLVERNDADIEKMHEKIIECRKYMNLHFNPDFLPELLKQSLPETSNIPLIKL